MECATIFDLIFFQATRRNEPVERLIASRPKFELLLGPRKENCTGKGKTMATVKMASWHDQPRSALLVG
jgi:hypothetical protein